MAMLLVRSVSEFEAALADRDADCIIAIAGSLVFSYSIVVPAGVKIVGDRQDSSIISFSNSDGFGLTADNEVSNLTIQTNPSCRAIYTLSDRETLGSIKLSHLTITGQVQVLVRPGSRSLRLVAEDIDVVSCDSRRYSEQPQKYGVNVYQGAFTVYNFNPDSGSVIRATLTGLSIGRRGAPVLGSGIFVSGRRDEGGQVEVDEMTVREVFSNGMLPEGTSHVITAGVFVLDGVHVKVLRNSGVITTYGVNDMVLDAWGTVDDWLVEKTVTSYGASGIGFVNFGTVGVFEARENIETFGPGARGFNQYDGTIKQATFKSLITHGHGSVGVQISKPIGTLDIKESVITHGSLGNTLFKRQISRLPANGISIKEGGEVENLIVGKTITTCGDGVSSLEIDGKILNLSVKEEILATGNNSIGVRIGTKGEAPLNGTSIKSTAGIAVHRENGL